MSIPVMIGLVLAAAIFSWLLQRRRRRWPALGCGTCGYPAAGLERLTCPECGSDLTRVGILMAPPPRSDLVRSILLWSLAVLVIGAVCTQLLYSSVIGLRQQRSMLTMSWNSGGNRRIEIEVAGPIEGDVARLEQATVSVIKGSKPAPKLDLRLPPLIESSPWHGGGGGGADGAQRSWQHLADCMNSAGVTLENPAAREEAMLAADRLVSLAFVGQSGNGAGSSSDGIQSLTWSGQKRAVGVPLVLGVWVLLWLGGCVVLIQHWHRSRRDIAAPEPES